MGREGDEDGRFEFGGFDSNSSLSFEQYMCAWNGQEGWGLRFGERG